MNCLIILATAVCILLPTIIEAQNPDEVVCLAKSDPLERRTLKTRAEMGDFVGWSIATNQDECIALPFVNGSAQSGFFPNYCGRAIPEAEDIYCPTPECICRYDTAGTKYEVKKFDNEYPAASTICLLRNTPQYTGVTSINLAKCNAIVGTSAIWVQSTTSCQNLK